MCDEIFGRKNFVRNIVWQKKYTTSNDSKSIPDSHDHILVYQKSSMFKVGLLPRSEKQDAAYKYDDGDGRGPWRSDNILVKSFSQSGVFPIINPNTKQEYYPPEGKCWRTNEENMKIWLRENRIYFGKDGKGAPQLKRYLYEVKQGVVPNSWWSFEDAGHNDQSKKELQLLFPGDPFSTPKPEKLLHRILALTTSPNDLVLDSFAGSGTTGAVAHKMGRRWIMIELGEHCHTHIIPRLKKVIDGEDPGGITEAVQWRGGGGFRYYRLAPSLLEKDHWGNWVINKTYNAEMLAEAICKIEGFTYAPSDTFYWQQGYSTERDFIYVTTQNLSHEQLSQLSDEVGEHRSLLVLCSAFRSQPDAFDNLTIKKIPKQILSRCEWGKDDYSLNVENLPQAPQKTEQKSLFNLDNF